MAYAVVHEIAASWHRYQLIAKAFVEPEPDGLILHLGGPTEEGIRMISVWQSAEAWERFRVDRLAQALAAVAGPAQPEPIVRELRPAHVVLGRIQKQ
jgi:hypothetical protein